MNGNLVSRLLAGKLLLLLLLSLLATGCFWASEFETRHLTGHYYLSEVEPDSGDWYLHFEDDEFGMGDALFNERVVEAGFNEKYIVLRAVGGHFYIVPLSDTENREVARRSITGPLPEDDFQAARRRSGAALPAFDPTLTQVD